MIIKSFLDSDMYKFTMAQFIHRYYPKTIVRYKLTNRGENFYVDKNRLGAELYNLHTLRPTEEELEYLENLETCSFFNPVPTKVFSSEFIDFLRNFSTDELTIYTYRTHNGQITIEIQAPWKVAVFYEVQILAIMSELRSNYIKEECLNINPLIELVDKEKIKIKIDKINKERSFRFSDFGTRRRKSFEHHDIVLDTLMGGLESYHLSGTSNLYFAMKYGIRPVGTFAHELPMVISGIYPKVAYPILMSQWKAMYGKSLNILLPDTFTSDWLFHNHGAEVITWEGVRHDSGDPFKFIEKYIKLLESFRIDPMERVIVFSDGLDISRAMSILEYCRDRVWVTFGIGTKLTHDTAIKPPNIVMKVEAVVAGEDLTHVVKLSDEKGKHTGDPTTIQKYKEIFEC